MLITHFTEKMANREGAAPRPFSADAIDRLSSLSWPGNVRELRNTVERLVILCSGDEVRADDVDLLASGRTGGPASGGELMGYETFADFKEHAERAYIVHKLHENDWNVAETSRRIDMPRSNLYKKIEKYGLVRDS